MHQMNVLIGPAALVRVFAVLLVMVCAAPASSGALLYDISGRSSGSAFAGFGGNWGLRFTLSQSTTVASFGLWDEGSDGLAGAHSVGVFTTGGSLLGSAIVNNSSIVVPSAASVGRWLFTDLGSTFNLSEGTYVLGLFDQAVGNDPFRGNAATTFMAGASYNEARARSGAPSFAMPDGVSGVNQGWFGPNLSTTALASSTVPEPSSGAMLLLAAIACHSWCRRPVRAL